MKLTRSHCIAGICFILASILTIDSAGAKIETRQNANDRSTLNPETLVREWFARLNALDDWSPENAENQVKQPGDLTSDPQESEEPSSVTNVSDPIPFVENFVELYHPDAFFFVRPNENQLGPVMYYKHSGVRVWAEHYAKTFFDLAYRINEQTAREITTNLFYTTILPWKGLAVSVEFTAVYTFRNGEKKFTAPGAAFFQFTEDGKILRLRLYELKDETFEVIP